MTGDIIIPYLGFILCALFPYVVYIVWYFAEPGFPWHTYITNIIGYYATFGILLIVPIDIASIVMDRRSRYSYSDPNYDFDVDTLSMVYNVFFTILLIMGSFVLGFEEYYNTDGEKKIQNMTSEFFFLSFLFSCLFLSGYFTIGGRVSSAFKRMVIDMIPGLVVGIIILST